MAAPVENARRGAALLVAAAVFFAATGAAIKHVSSAVGTDAIVFFRSSLGLLPLLPFLYRRGWRGIRTSCFRLHLVRALSGLAAMYCFFYAIAHLHLAEAVVLNYTAPLFIPFVARFWLHEAIPPRVGAAAAVGFAGVLLILKPGAGLFSSAAPIGVVGGVLAALAFVGIRRLTDTEPTSRVVFWFGTVSSVVSAVPLFWTWQTPPAEVWSVLLLIGLLAGGGQILLTQAYAHAPAAQIGPFSYATVVFAALFGWWLWDEVPDLLSFAGAALVCAAGILATWGSSRAAAATPADEAVPAAAAR